MLVEKSERTPQDLTQVNLEEEWEVRFWCTHFNLGEGELRSCVAEVGPRVDAIERRLHEAGRKAFTNTGED